MVIRPSRRKYQLNRKLAKNLTLTAIDEHEELDSNAVKSHILRETIRAENYIFARSDTTTIRNFVYERGLIGATPTPVYCELVNKLGVDPADTILCSKIKQRVANEYGGVRRVRKMVAEDPIELVTGRISQQIIDFSERSGAPEAIVKKLLETPAIKAEIN